MASKRFVWCLTQVILISGAVLAVENNTESCDGSGFGYELVQQRLDQLQLSFMEVYVHVKELGELVANNQRTIDQNQLQTNQLVMNNQRTIQQTQQQTNQLVQALENQVASNVSLMVSYSKQILDLQTICANHDSIRKEILKINPSFTGSSCHQHQKSFESPKKSLDPVDSCDKTNSTSSGLFSIPIENFDQPVVVLCELQKIGGGWLVIQHRFDGSIDFYRNWTEYKNGFGKAEGEFWLGLEKMHQITKQGKYELMIELETFGGNYTYARFSEFEIGSESEQYKLKKLGTYSGTAGDQLTKHTGMKFSTVDRDNDSYGSGNCAVVHKGGWWYNGCGVYCNLNSQYIDKYDGAAIYWAYIKAGFKFTRMMIRKSQ